MTTETTLYQLLMHCPVIKMSKSLASHLVYLHEDGKIEIDVDYLKHSYKNDQWDGSIIIDIKDLSVHDVIQLIVSPMTIITRFNEIKMIDNTKMIIWKD